MGFFLEEFSKQVMKNPDALAFSDSLGNRLSYHDLSRKAKDFAEFLSIKNPSKYPVVLKGHKEPDMVVAMLGAMFAGQPYVPIDSSIPKDRAANIVGQLKNCVLINIAQGKDSLTIIGSNDDEASEASVGDQGSEEAVREFSVDNSQKVSPNDAHYILFTSGSTGEPKGVIQPYRSFDATSKYFKRFLPDGEELTLFNRAHFSFDLSLFDLAVAFPYGNSLFVLDAETEESLAKTFAALEDADINMWVSTPSYAAMCLRDPSFNESLLPNLRSFVFCGETLPNSVASDLHEKFPSAKIINSYGPTETQAAITDVEITEDMIQADEPLPVGSVSPYNRLFVVDRESHSILPAGETGEIAIAGETLATGYFGKEDLTEAAFIEIEDPQGQGQYMRVYLTGDAGYLDKDEMLHFLGRFDHQVKVNGFRIELQEIEETLRKLPEVLDVCVVPVKRNGSNIALAAHVVLTPGVEESRTTTKMLKESLKHSLPAYMIPRNVYYYSELPQNTNGKIDRKALSVASSSKSGK